MDSRTKNYLRELAREAAKESGALYVVGGAIRDRLLGRNFRDIDLICEDAKRWAHWFSKRIHSTTVMLHDSPGQEVIRVPISKNLYCDFCSRQGASLEEDLANRDFTINAIAQPLERFLGDHANHIDLFEGVQDIKNRVIRRLPGDPFEADPLRILRAFRQASVLDFCIDPETMQAITENATNLEGISSERISQELWQMFSCRKPDIAGLQSSGILEQLIKNAGIKIKVPENLIHHWRHFLADFSNLDSPLNTQQSFYRKLFEKEDTLASFGISLLFTELETETAQQFMRHYKFSNCQNERVSAMVRLYKVIHQQWINDESPPSKSTLYNWCTDYENVFPYGLLLVSTSPEIKNKQKFCEMLFTTGLDFFRNQYLPATSAKPLISGNDLQHSFNLKPSPLFKTLLGKIRKARVLGEVSTKKQAETFVQKLITKESS